MQKPSLQGIPTTRTSVMGVPGLCIGKGLKNARGCRRIAQRKSGASQRLRVHTGIDIPQKLLHLVPLS